MGCLECGCELFASNCFVLSHNDSLNACLPSGRKYVPEKNLKCGQLQAILGMHLHIPK